MKPLSMYFSSPVCHFIRLMYIYSRQYTVLIHHRFVFFPLLEVCKETKINFRLKRGGKTFCKELASS
jgi:hypothetical protein